MRYFFFKNSNEHEKNMFPYVERYVTDSKRGPSRYQFVHDMKGLFTAFVDKADNLSILHPMADLTNFKTQPFPYKLMNLHELANIMDVDGSVHLIAVDCPSSISDQDLLNSSKLAVMAPDGEFVDPTTRLPLTEESPSSSILLVSGFKIGTSPVYLFIVHYPFINSKVTAMTTDSYKVKNILEIESIKSVLFPCKFIKGVETVIGSDTVFCNGDVLTIQLVDGGMISPAHINIMEMVTVECPHPYTLDQANGRIHIDISMMTSKTAAPLRIEINAGSFLKSWIYHSQRFFYEYSLYKMV